VDRLRTICCAFPEVTERLSCGEPVWFVRSRKLFVTCADHDHDDRRGWWCVAPEGPGCAGHLAAGAGAIGTLHLVAERTLGCPRLALKPSPHTEEGKRRRHSKPLLPDKPRIAKGYSTPPDVTALTLASRP
jgi:hypothetical protein